MENIFSNSDEAPVINFVNSVIYRMLRNKATEIHIIPKANVVVYYLLIDGEMVELLRQPSKTMAAVSSRIKVMGKFDIAEKRVSQQGLIQYKQGVEILEGHPLDQALSLHLITFPNEFGERLMLRRIENSSDDLESFTNR